MSRKSKEAVEGREGTFWGGERAEGSRFLAEGGRNYAARAKKKPDSSLDTATTIRNSAE